METVIPINDIIEATRHRRNHSRHHSMGTLSFKSLDLEDESEEPQNAGHSRKASLQEVPYSLTAWSMMSNHEVGSFGMEDNEQEDTEDDRQDARERLLSEDGTGRERLLSDDNMSQLYSKLSTINSNYDDGSFERDDSLLSQDIGFEVELREENKSAMSTCFRGVVVGSCPEMPTYHQGGLHPVESERVDLLLRRARAFSEDSSTDMLRRATSMDLSSSSIVGVRVRSYGRRESMNIDAKYGSVDNSESLTESPTSTWLYWEENLNNASPSSPFAEAFQVPQF